VQLVLDTSALEQLTKPRALGLRVPWKIEHDRYALRQESANVRRERVLQSRRAPDESRDIGDLAGIEVIQELVLHKQDGIFALGQLSRQRGLPCPHLAAQENQLR